ncbi:MAG: aromatic ring-hydroxylating dioxygenase subunit alpha [Alphaproteobacteria bacterium]|nr:aromatic ring-hydroxylating dioxygenase subunit alpha [Alphaproteobacteria bacterium]
MRQPEDLLNPRHYDRVRQEPLEAETLPSWCYTSQEWFDLEVKHIFMKSWNLIGRVDRVPNPGDFVTLTYAGVPVIVARGRDNVVRAFANTCRHRGAMLLEGEGNCKAAIKCPYHGWVYGLDGALQGAPDMDETKNFDRADYGLIPVRLETWGGFMFINFDKDAPTLKEWVGEIHDMIAPWDAENLVCTRRKEFELKCNWKLYVENFNDVGHIKTVHKESLQKLSEKYDKPSTYEARKAEGFTFFSYHAGTRTLLDGIDKVKGFDPIPATVQGRGREGSFYPTIMPLACTGFCIDSAWALEMYPLGPDRMKLVVNSCFHKDALKRPDFEKVAQMYYDRMDIAVPEDNAINELMQRGLGSPQAIPGRIGKLETAVTVLNTWWLDRVLGPSTQPRAEKESDARAA